MIWILLPKLAFWFVVIGAFSLVTPNPAWPEWVGKALIGTGVGMVVLSIVFAKYRISRSPKKDSSEDS